MRWPSRKTLLLRQIEAIKQDLDYRRSSTESVLRAEIQQRVDHAVDIANTLYQRNRGAGAMRRFRR